LIEPKRDYLIPEFFVFITITISFSCDSFLYFVHLLSSWTFIDLSEFLRGKTLLYFLVQSNFNYTWNLTFVHRIMSINTILFIQPAGKIKNRQSRNIHKKTSFKMPKWPSDPVNRYFVHLMSSWTFIDLSEFLHGKTLLYFLVQSTSFYPFIFSPLHCFPFSINEVWRSFSHFQTCLLVYISGLTILYFPCRLNK
jgi:hypothetical protein